MTSRHYGWPRTSDGRLVLILAVLITVSQIGWAFCGNPASAWFVWTIVALVVDLLMAFALFVGAFGLVGDWVQRGEGGDLDPDTYRNRNYHDYEE